MSHKFLCVYSTADCSFEFEAERISRSSTHVPGRLGTRPHKFPGVDEMTLSPTNKPLVFLLPRPYCVGNSHVLREQLTFTPEDRYSCRRAAVTTSIKLEEFILYRYTLCFYFWGSTYNGNLG